MGGSRPPGPPVYNLIGKRPDTAEQQQQTLVEWNNTQLDYPRDLCIHELIETVAKNNPQAIAVDEYHEFSDQFVFDSQMLIRAVLVGFRIEEVAIPTHYADDSSSVDIPSSIRYILETFGALFHGLKDRKRLEQEFRERSDALSL